MPVKLRRRILAIAVCLALIAPSYAQSVPIAVARGPVSLLVYVAEARGFFAKEGVDVRQVACTSGKECLKLLRDGAAAFCHLRRSARCSRWFGSRRSGRSHPGHHQHVVQPDQGRRPQLGGHSGAGGHRRQAGRHGPRVIRTVPAASMARAAPHRGERYPGSSRVGTRAGADVPAPFR